MAVDPEILPTFLVEARGYLERLRDPASSSRQRREAAHGLRGAAAMMGLSRLERCAQQLERLLTRGEGDHPDPRLLSEIAGRLDRLDQHGDDGEDPRPAQGEASTIEEEWDPETTAMLRNLFVEEAQEHLETISAALLQLGKDDNSTPIRQMLRKAHTLKGSASTVGLPRISRAAHQLEEILVQIRQSGRALDHRDQERLFGAVDLLRAMADAAHNGDASDAQLQAFVERLQRLQAPWEPGDPPVSPATDGQNEDEQGGYGPAPGPAEQQGSDRRAGDGRRIEDTRRVRVDVSRLDNLMNAVGELVVQRTRIEQRVAELKGLARDLSTSRRDLHDSLGDLPEGESRLPLARIREVDVEVADAVANLERATDTLMEDSETLRRTTHSLQDYITRIRMMPVRWLHARLQRPIREAAAREGKLIELIVEEESTEMDRSAVEQITDPLIHLVRNAVAHGIEPPQRRVAAGKPAAGQIWVRARVQGDLVFFEVEDDGEGIAPERLRQALREQGELSEEQIAALSREDLFRTIFVSGFSTRAQADELAGRGMGLDVVHRNISAMGGTIAVSSRLGRGTRFMVQMPISTGITEAVLFKVGEPVYAIPVAHVVETVFAEPAELRWEEGGTCGALRHREQQIPILVLHQILGGDRPLPLWRTVDPTISQARQPVLVLQFGETRFGITCTRVIGPRQVVLKRLGRLLARIPLFAGATISGSSKVQFVLDINALAQLATTSPAPRISREPRRPLPPRILVVDDSRSIRTAMEQMLRTAGFAVDVAADGWEAWERLQLRSYDLLLTDLEMPRFHGYELIAKCRRSPGLQNLPILVLTSRTAEQNRKVAMARGADGFLAKPINRRLVLQQIGYYIQNPEGGRARGRPH